MLCKPWGYQDQNGQAVRMRITVPFCLVSETSQSSNRHWHVRALDPPVCKLLLANSKTSHSSPLTDANRKSFGSSEGPLPFLGGPAQQPLREAHAYRELPSASSLEQAWLKKGTLKEIQKRIHSMYQSVESLPLQDTCIRPSSDKGRIGSTRT
jgi:hypothetical protein